ncbi:MAG: hypothetical protein AAFV80_20220, partial [Bacteroidota bacterium]
MKVHVFVVLFYLLNYGHLAEAQFQIGNQILGEASGNNAYYSAISADGLTVAIGEPKAYTIGSNDGLVRVFEWDGSAWIQKGQNIDGWESNHELGRVALSGDGNRLIVGPSVLSKPIRVYEYDGSSWVQVGNTFTVADMGSGLSKVDISLDGSR